LTAPVFLIGKLYTYKSVKLVQSNWATSKHSIPLDLFKEAFPNEAEALMNGVCST
jgi:hypothetical protein